MTTHTTVAPPSAVSRPTLALILGILAAPGSTVAWDLPAGGLYIGLPLAVAAIVVGRAARRDGVGRGRATAGIVLASLCLLQMAIWTLVSLVS
jgi:hypothetical protein